MKTLLVLRHAKAVGTDLQGDHHRSLSHGGRHDATTIGTLVRRFGLEPTLALVSDAVRTRETAELVVEALGTPVEMRYDARLYEASPGALLDAVKESGSAAQTVLIVGHNPGIGEFARMLVGSGEPQALIGLQGSFPTAALAIVECPLQSWNQLVPKIGALTRYITPSDFETGL